MACETDSYTKRPRTSNDPYTVMTDEQIRNIKQVYSEYVSHLVCSKRNYTMSCMYLIVTIERAAMAVDKGMDSNLGNLSSNPILRQILNVTSIVIKES